MASSEKTIALPVLLEKKTLSITMLHRSAVKVFYASKREAEADGYRAYARVNKHGQVHAFAGLRGDAKKLYHEVARGKEPRVRMVMVKAGGGKMLTQRCFDEATLIVWATGYTSRKVEVLNLEGLPVKLAESQNQVIVDLRGRVSSADGAEVERLYGSGHGYGAPSFEDGDPDG